MSFGSGAANGIVPMIIEDEVLEFTLAEGVMALAGELAAPLAIGAMGLYQIGSTLMNSTETANESDVFITPSYARVGDKRTVNTNFTPVTDARKRLRFHEEEQRNISSQFLGKFNNGRKKKYKKKSYRKKRFRSQIS
jgi:hypothetical protein